jgi:23S rRNA pseudouridine1911/1915/1917 synthase
MKFINYKASTEIPLLDFLATLFPKSSKNTLRQWVKEGRIFVDDKRVQKAQLLMLPGQTVTFGPRVRYLEGGVRLLYEDKDLVAVEKPAGMLSVATNFEQKDTIHALLRRYFHPRRVQVVHRLDQDTSGVMIFALSEQGKEGLKELFVAHDLLRQYVAIVEGRLTSPKGTWESYLIEDKNYKVRVARTHSQGELAITHYLLEGATRTFSRLRLTLETGRKNQIRVHCQEAGHPVVGDYKYGAKTDVLKRLALHAHRLELVHPISGKQLAFCSPIPEEFDRLVAAPS